MNKAGKLLKFQKLPGQENREERKSILELEPEKAGIWDIKHMLNV